MSYHKKQAISRFFGPVVSSDTLKPYYAKIKNELTHHALFIGLVISYCGLCYLYVLPYRENDNNIVLQYVIAGAVPLTFIFGFRLFGEVIYHTLHVRPLRVRRICARFLHSEMFESDRLLRAVVPLCIIPIFSISFTNFKTAIPEIQEFSWDVALSDIDKNIHFGKHPWEWVHPILGYPVITSMLSYVYNLWHPIMWLIVYWQIFSNHCRIRRMQILLAFFFCWAVLGSFIAVGFSSAGPCFYGDVVDGPNPYNNLIAYLSSAHDTFYNSAIPAQEYLWSVYTSKSVDVGGGISAMPSLHLAIATIIAMFARGYGRLSGFVGFGFLLLVFLGSIHLGWHYAVDSYAGILGGLLAWRISGWLSRWIVWYPREVLSEGPEQVSRL